MIGRELIKRILDGRMEDQEVAVVGTNDSGVVITETTFPVREVAPLTYETTEDEFTALIIDAELDS